MTNADSGSVAHARADGSPILSPALSVEDVEVRFGGVCALGGVSLQARQGQVVGVIGPNGSGKTTLFDTISGLTRPTAGRLLFAGTDITGKTAVWRARWGLRRTFQRQQVFGRLSVEDNLLAALEWQGGGGTMAADLVHLPTRSRYERRRRQEVDRALEICGLHELRAVAAGSLPIGAARLLEFARALVARPKILLLDEPTSGLGTRDSRILVEALESFRANKECTTLLVEHDVNFVMKESDYIYVLASGKVLASGTPRQIQEHPDVIAGYLG
jgi:branched-chain amino acid transport system ATP-binding protein